MANTPPFQRIPEPPSEALPLLAPLRRRFGRVPALFGVLALSPHALRGFLKVADALDRGDLNHLTHVRVALAVAQVNGSRHGIARHTALARKYARLGDAEIAASRAGRSSDTGADAVVRLAAAIAARRGRVISDDIDRAQAAGLGHAALVEVIVHVALETFANYVTSALHVPVDDPWWSAKPQPGVLQRLDDEAWRNGPRRRLPAREGGR